MSGNVWEWCQDAFTRDIGKVPADGSAYTGPGSDRVPRGGCFHNWAAHCNVFNATKLREAHDACIGFQLVLAWRGSSPPVRVQWRIFHLISSIFTSFTYTCVPAAG
jgi:hypothetical protein